MGRFTVEFPEDVDKMLGKLAESEKTSKREVIRRALALYNYLQESGVKAGGDKKVSITDKQDKILKDILF
jgi:predicted transcriptional regulator